VKLYEHKESGRRTTDYSRDCHYGSLFFLVYNLNLTLRQGVACIWDTEAGLFMPDFDVTIVYEGNIETQEWLYYEQDGMVVTLGNWLNGRLSCEQIEQLWCELIIPENNDNSEV